jgi:transcriptional regulator with XRE-family HTH domain
MSTLAQQIGTRLRQLREAAGVEAEYLDEKLILGPGWVSRFESGVVAPPFDAIVVLLQEVGADPSEFFSVIELPDSPAEISRLLRATQAGNDLRLDFPYGAHQATYLLEQASLDDFEAVLAVMRNHLAGEVTAVNAQAVKTDAVASCFLEAVNRWPHANPSDLWYFVVNRAYVDPFNHPAQNASLDFSQSWKRTGGWALELVLWRHYHELLERHGVRLHVGGTEKARLAAHLEVRGRVELDKIDVLVTGVHGDREVPFGVIHVKTSFAERRTDDVPLSEALVRSGYASPLWTMDAKATPSAKPVNRGELGDPRRSDGSPDRRSAKRKDIEDDGYFSACFSYNSATRPTPADQQVRSRVIVCDFRDPDDEFAAFLVQAWNDFSARL